MFSVNTTHIRGCFEIQPRVFDDVRGRFVKVFHGGEFSKLGLECHFAEEYYSHSKRGVVRGLHFQTPPFDHVKLVYCVQGEVEDVVLDLRKGSPTYGKTVSINLSADRGNFVYIPKGLAHGFCVISKTATLVYKVSTVYAPSHDAGVLWSSIGYKWSAPNPIVSERDAHFPKLNNFNSPFCYE